MKCTTGQGLFDTSVGSDAVLSECGLYRYQLTRTWELDVPAVNFVMLNPSTADAATDDPTIRRCLGFARRWGCGRMVVTNLFALRATRPRNLWGSTDPKGPDADQWLEHSAQVCDFIVCAWGNFGSFAGRSDAVRKILLSTGRDLFCFGVTSHLEPLHPLYLASNRDRMPWLSPPTSSQSPPPV